MNLRAFGDTIEKLIRSEITEVMTEGCSKHEAAIIVAQVAMSSAVGFTAAAMGAAQPSVEQVSQLTNRIIGLVAELPKVREMN